MEDQAKANDQSLLQESEKALKDYLSILAEMQEVKSWKEVLESLFREEHRAALRKNARLIKQSIFRLLDLLLLPPGCSSKDVFSRILDAYIRCRWSCYPCLIPRDAFVYYRRILLEPEGVFMSSLDEFSGSYNYRMKMKMLLQDAFLDRNLWYLRIHLNYGLDISVEETILDFTFLLITKALIQIFKDRNMEFSLDYHYAYSKIYDTLEQNGGSMNSRHQRGFARITHIAESLYAVRHCCRMEDEVSPFSTEEECASSVRFLEAYWDTLTDPLVSEEEVREFLLLTVKDRPDVVDHVVDEFVRLFGRRAYEPRSLSHLCRCTLRNTIVQRASVTLPAAVELLDLPSSIKRFVLCNPERLSLDKVSVAGTSK